jgi:5-(carboxyamino)imidazole ribonucleotide synthase
MWKSFAKIWFRLKTWLAVMVCRNPSGNQNISVVEMEFHPEANQVEYIYLSSTIDSAVAEEIVITYRF